METGVSGVVMETVQSHVVLDQREEVEHVTTLQQPMVVEDVKVQLKRRDLVTLNHVQVNLLVIIYIQ